MKMNKTAVLVIGICGIACNAMDRSTQEREHVPLSVPVHRGLAPVNERSDIPLADGVGASEASPRSSDLQPSEAPSPPVLAFSLSGHDSIYQALLGTNASVAIFSNDDGVVAIDSLGVRVRISDQSFRQVAIDYDLGILWLDRVSSKVGDPGLFIMDIFGSELSLTKVTRLTKGFEIIGLDGSPLLITEGSRPYRVIVDSNEKLQIRVRADGAVACGDECNPSAGSISVISAAIKRRLSSTVPTSRIELLPVPTSHEDATFKNGTTLDIPGFSLVLRYVRRPGNHGFGWQLYDKETKEYISSSTFARSKDPWPEEVNHLMVCDGNQLVVIEYAFFDSNLQRLEAGNNHTYGVCLSGGLLFQNRTGFAFTDHAN